MQLVCPAGSLPALKVAVREGADAIYVGFRDDTNARHFAGLNLDDKQFDSAVAHVREHRRQLYVAVNTYAPSEGWERWRRAVDRAADFGVDALIAADPGVLAYASRRHPQLALHLSVQGSATNAAALAFYQQRYGIRRAVLPRVLSLAQVRQVAAKSPVLLAYSWPGNVRELEHVISRAALKVLSQAQSRTALLSIEAPWLGLEGPSTALEPVTAVPPAAVVEPLQTAIERCQRQAIERALGARQGRWAAAARDLQMDPSNLRKLARRLNLI